MNREELTPEQKAAMKEVDRMRAEKARIDAELALAEAKRTEELAPLNAEASKLNAERALRLAKANAEAADIAAAGAMIEADDDSREQYADGLRYTVALSVGLAIVLGVLRILKGWPLQRLIIGGYILVVIMTIFAPEEIIGIAYDSGGVTTSTITVPLVTALGVGLASSIRGRNPMIDGFGLIALASLSPMIFVMIYGMWIA